MNEVQFLQSLDRARTSLPFDNCPLIRNSAGEFKRARDAVTNRLMADYEKARTSGHWHRQTAIAFQLAGRR